jgi:polar amino acid transport system substrate-binding protein
MMQRQAKTEFWFQLSSPAKAGDPVIAGPSSLDAPFSRGMTVRFGLAGLALAALASIAPASAQPHLAPPGSTQPTVASGSVAIPGFWDPRRRPERPDLSRVTLIRFITEIDYPPFNYSGPDGNPAGLNVDLARMVCEELKIACTVQMRRFDTLLPSLGDNRGDAVMASIAVTPETRKLADFSDPYYRTPGRFAARRDTVINDVRPEQLEGKKVAVLAGTAHEAFLKALFTEVDVRPYETPERSR